MCEWRMNVWRTLGAEAVTVCSPGLISDRGHGDTAVTKTTGSIMGVHRKVSEHCRANQVSGRRHEAGQTLGKGQ